MAILKNMVKCRHAFKTATTFDDAGNPINGPFERVFTQEIFNLIPTVVFNHVTYPNGGWVQIANEDTIAKQKAAAASLQKAAAASLQKAAAADESTHLELIAKIETAFDENPDSLDNIEASELKLYAEIKNLNWSKQPKNKVFESLKEQYEAARG